MYLFCRCYLRGRRGCRYDRLLSVYGGAGDGQKLIGISLEATIPEAVAILSSCKFHALPVCEGSLLVGIVTTTDLIKYLIDQYK